MRSISLIHICSMFMILTVLAAPEPCFADLRTTTLSCGSALTQTKILAYRGISIRTDEFNPIWVDEGGLLYATPEKGMGYARGFASRQLPSQAAARALLKEGTRYFGVLIEYGIEAKALNQKKLLLNTAKVDNDLRSANRIGVYDLEKIASGSIDSLVWMSVDAFVTQFVPPIQRKAFFSASRSKAKDQEQITSLLKANQHPPEEYQIQRTTAIHMVKLSYIEQTEYHLEYIDGNGRSRIAFIPRFEPPADLLKTVIPVANINPIHAPILQDYGAVKSFDIEHTGAIFSFENKKLNFKQKP